MINGGRIIITLLLASIFFTGEATAKFVEEHIYLVPAGNVDAKTIGMIKDALPGKMPMTVSAELSPREDMPEAAYDPSRRQYNAELILNDISRKIKLDTRVEGALIIVDVDIYSPSLGPVLGIADASKRIGVISLARLRNEFYGKKPDNALFQERAVKEAMYEMGCIWGLSSCPDKKCVMYPSVSLSDMDKKKGSFCHECQKKLHNRSGGPLFKAALPVLR